MDSVKKLFMGVTVGVAVLSLAACGSSADLTTGTTEKSDLTLEQVYDKAIERQESMQSAKANIVMDQVTAMTLEGEEMNMTSSTNMDMEMTVKPVAFFVDGTVTMEMAGESEAMDMPLQMYMTEADGFYMNDFMTGGWSKLPENLTEDMLAQMGAQADASEQLKQLKGFINDFTFEQTDDAYILTLVADGEKFNEVMLGQVMGSLNQLGEDEQSLLEGITFEDAKYVITIDKKTFDTVKMDMDFIMNMDVMGQQSKVDTKSTVTYSEFDNVDTITIPQEVLDTATETAF